MGSFTVAQFQFFIFLVFSQTDALHILFLSLSSFLVSEPQTNICKSFSMASEGSASSTDHPNSSFAHHTMPSLNQAFTVRLDQSNYLLWRTQMLNIIIANGLEEMIHGKIPAPSRFLGDSENINPEYSIWQRQNRLVMCWIYSSLTEGVMAQIIGLDTASEIWTALEKIFSAASKARIMQLRFQLQTTKKRGLSMMEYLLKIKSIVDNLLAIGENITEQDRILYLLAGLRAEYNSFVITVTSRHEPLSLEEIHSMLLTHENRLEQQHTTEETNLLQANITTMNIQGHNKKNQKSSQFKTQGRGNQNQQQFNHQNFGRGRGRGHYNNNGGNFGHGPGRGSFNNHSYSSGNFNNVSGGSNGKPQCQVCGKYGHIAINCYHRFDQTYQPTMNNHLAAMVATPSTVGDESWYMDTGATHHLTPNLNKLNSHTPFAGSDKVMVGNGNRLNISNIGHSTISSASRSLNLKNILHVPQLTTNLISVNRLCTDNNVTVEFFTNGFVVKDQASKKALLQGNLNYGLYKLSSSAPSRRYQDPDDNKLAGRTSLTTEVPCMSSTLQLSNKADLWHFRLGHPAHKIVNKVLSACSLPPEHWASVCEPCQMAKSHRLPFTLSESRASQPFALVHSDLWGPAPVVGTNGARYFVLFVDDHTRFSWLYLLASKDQVISVFL